MNAAATGGHLFSLGIPDATTALRKPLPTSSVLHQLWSVILDRQSRPSEKSYTASLLAGGVEKIGRKVTEEAAEVVEAAGEPGEAGREHLIREAADLVYHLFVMLACRDATLDQVEAELARRFGMSGLEEKASRPAAAGDRPAS